MIRFLRNILPPKPGKVEHMMEFLISYYALHGAHAVYDTGITFTWERAEGGYRIYGETLLLEIDGEDAAAAAEKLRHAILRAKQTPTEATDPVRRYSLQRRAADRVILEFFGTEHLAEPFWSIEHCDYREGKHLFFSVSDAIPQGQSLEETLQSIEQKARQLHPNTRVERGREKVILIYF